MTKKPRGTAKPSERLAANRRAKGKADTAPAAVPVADSVIEPAIVTIEAKAVVERPTPMRVITKFVVADKTEVPVIVDRELRTRHHVKLEAVYEPQSILNGMATVQGNQDNRIFGDDKPEAAIVMVIHSKAIADTLRVGRAFEVIFKELI